MFILDEMFQLPTNGSKITIFLEYEKSRMYLAFFAFHFEIQKPRATECLQNIIGTDYVVFVLILFPQMSNILLLKSVPVIQPQMSNKICVLTIFM